MVTSSTHERSQVTLQYLELPDVAMELLQGSSSASSSLPASASSAGFRVLVKHRVRDVIDKMETISLIK